MTQTLNGLDLGSWVNDQSMTLGAWLTVWLEENADRRSVKTMANYRGHVRDVWGPRLGHLKLRDIRRHHIERVLGELIEPLDGRVFDLGV